MIHKFRNNLFFLYIFISIISLIIFFLTLARFFAAPIEKKIQYVPDDTFYYLKIAQCAAEQEMWSFDGKRPTTGVHWFHVYILKYIYKFLHPKKINFMYICIILSYIGIFVSLIIIYNFLKIEFNKKIAIIVTIFWLTSYANVRGSLTGTEYGWATLGSILISFYYYLHFYKNLHTNVSFTITGIFIGFLAVMFRTDLILMVFAYGLVSIIFFFLYYINSTNRTSLPLSNNITSMLSISLGGVLGLLLSFYTCFNINGHLLQDSGIIKHIWVNLIYPNNTINYFINSFKLSVNYFINALFSPFILPNSLSHLKIIFFILTLIFFITYKFFIIRLTEKLFLFLYISAILHLLLFSVYYAFFPIKFK